MGGRGGGGERKKCASTKHFFGEKISSHLEAADTFQNRLLKIKESENIANDKVQYNSFNPAPMVPDRCQIIIYPRSSDSTYIKFLWAIFCYCPQRMCTCQLFSFDHKKDFAFSITTGPVMGSPSKCPSYCKALKQHLVQLH